MFVLSLGIGVVVGINVEVVAAFHEDQLQEIRVYA
jgi:hypothetical protein